MAHMNFPPPTDDQAFERLIQELALPVLNARSAEINGRKGQSQQGVDVSVTLHTGDFVGIQCKQTKKTLKLAVVESEIIKARVYEPILNRFIVATTSERDAKLQKDVRQLPKEKFSVEIWDWTHINEWLNRYAQAGISYVQHVLVGDRPDAEQRHAEAMRGALDRPALLRGGFTEHNFDEQFQAIRDTSAFLRTGYLYTRDGRFVTGVLPLHNYGEDYVKLADPVLRKLDALDAHMFRSLGALNNYNHPDHAEAVAHLDVKRIAVLKAANRVFSQRGVSALPIH